MLLFDQMFLDKLLLQLGKLHPVLKLLLLILLAPLQFTPWLHDLLTVVDQLQLLNQRVQLNFHLDLLWVNLLMDIEQEGASLEPLLAREWVFMLLVLDKMQGNLVKVN